MKQCNKCGQDKPLDEFRPTRNSCRVCERAYFAAHRNTPERMARNRRHRKNWRERNKQRERFMEHSWHARKLGLSATLTPDQWDDILAAFGFACAYCGRDWLEIEGVLQQEHVIPQSQGGEYTLDNIVPACRTCNLRKAYRTPEQAGMTIRDPLFDYKGKQSSDGNHPAKNDSAAAV